MKKVMVYILLFLMFSPLSFAGYEVNEDCLANSYYTVSAEEFSQQYSSLGSLEEIKIFPNLPTRELARLLLAYGLDATKFLNLLLSCRFDHDSFGPDPSLISLQQDLFALVLEHDIDLDQINYPQAVEVIRNKKSFVSHNQSITSVNLASALNDYFAKKGSDEFSDLRRNLEDGATVQCMGFTTAWLYSMWLQFTYPEKGYGYDSNWFTRTNNLLAKWNNKKDLSEKEAHEILRFGSIIDFFNGNPKKYLLPVNLGNLPQDLIEQRLNLSMLDIGDNILKKKYSIASIFDLEDLQKALEKTVHDDELVYIVYPGHVAGLIKHGDDYYFYDANSNGVVYKNTSIKKIAETIYLPTLVEFATTKIYSRYLEPGKVPLGIIVYGSHKKSYEYPSKKKFLKACKDINEETMFTSLTMAIQINCLESFRFFLKQAMELNFVFDDAYYSLFEFAIGYKATNIIPELLKNIDPNHAFKVYMSGASDEEYMSPLALAIQFGYIDIIKMLLDDPRTDINLKFGSEGKTAITYAEEIGRKQIVELLFSYKRNVEI